MRIFKSIGVSNLQMAEKLDHLLNKGEYRRNTSWSILQHPHHGAYFSTRQGDKEDNNRINTSKTLS